MPDIIKNAGGNIKVDKMPANTIKGNASPDSAQPTDIPIGSNTVLGRKGADIVAEQLSTDQISDSAVTYAKVQNVSTTDRVLGRSSVGAGSIEEIVLTAAARSLIDDVTVEDMRATLNVFSKAESTAQFATNDAMTFKGSIDASTNPNYPAAEQGYTYKISVSGRIGGASGPTVHVGDMIICTANGTLSGDQATVGANWVIVQSNGDGAVIGPTSATNGGIAVFDGVTGKLIKDSGKTVPTSAVVGTNDNQALTNKTIDGAVNTITNIPTSSYANDSVTFSKVQNVNQDRILGRASAGSGDIEEIVCTAAGRALLDDVSATAQRTTLGLGSAATMNVGTTTGTVAAGDHTHAQYEQNNNKVTSFVDPTDVQYPSAKLVNDQLAAIKDGTTKMYRVAHPIYTSMRPESGWDVISSRDDGEIGGVTPTWTRYAPFGTIAGSNGWYAAGLGWIGLSAPKPVRFTRIVAKGGTSFNEYPTRWAVEGSNDNVNWSIVLDKTGEDAPLDYGAPKVFDFPIENVDSYKYWRLRITAHTGTNSNMSYIRFYTDEVFDSAPLPADLNTYVGVRLQLSAAQIIPSGLQTALSWGADNSDVYGFRDPAKPTIITIPAGLGGKYEIVVGAALSSNSQGSRSISFKTNTGPARSIVSCGAAPDTTTTLNATLSGLQLNAGDTLTILASQTAGTDLTVTNLPGTFVSVRYLGK